MSVAISPDEYERFQTLIYSESGISLSGHKQELLVARLSKRLRELGLQTFSDYYETVTQDPTGEEFTRMLDLISTNKTEFFREPKHFEFLRDAIFPQLVHEKTVRIWSSACSTGEEPYTIAITLYEGVQNPTQWEFTILASDLSTHVVAKAAAGVYDVERVGAMPPEFVRRHFLRGRGEHDGLLKVKPHLAAMIRFRRPNLMDARFPIKSPLDVIFCRNVMSISTGRRRKRWSTNFIAISGPAATCSSGTRKACSGCSTHSRRWRRRSIGRRREA
jgi:chemotaxis protein methyltransferase CheR